MGLLPIRDLHVVLHKMNLSILDSGILIICATSMVYDVLIERGGLLYFLSSCFMLKSWGVAGGVWPTGF